MPFRIKKRKGAILGLHALGWLLVATGMIGTAAWLIQAVAHAREAARSAQCECHFKQLGLALLNYESTYGCLPPAYVADAQGKPLYSWRVLLMAELDRTDGWIGDEFWKKFRFDEPWDSPSNRAFHSIRPSSLFCPSDPEAAERGFTSILAVVGPGTLFPGEGESGRLADVRDDPNSTLMLVESANAAIHWMEPRDLDWNAMSFRVNDPSRPSISSKHPSGAYRGAHAVTANDMVRSLREDRSLESIKAMLLIDDGAKVEPPLVTRGD